MKAFAELRTKAQREYEQGNLERALAAYLRLRELQPDNPEIINNLGTVSFALGRPLKSCGYYLKALAIDRGYRIAWDNLKAVCQTQIPSCTEALNRRRTLQPQQKVEGACHNRSPKSEGKKDVEHIDYSQHWYTQYYAHEIVQAIQSPIDLLKAIHDRPSKYRWRFTRWFEDLELKGKVLEVGFHIGKSSYYLVEYFDEIQLDGIDFNPSLEHVAEILPGLHRNLNEFWICNVETVNKPDGFYGHITCLDFIEHIPEHVYLNMIGEFQRLLGAGGRVYVYVGQGNKLPEHIHVVPDTKVIGDFSSRGFSLANYKAEEHFMVFEKVQALPRTPR